VTPARQLHPQGAYDALLVVSFGGPEREEDVIPFLENVLRGKNVPRERMIEVAGHYYHFGGKSPINEQNRALIAALESELTCKGPSLPIYWGNRNWHPMLADTVRRMRVDGIRRALAFATSAFGSYSGCRQYREDIERARLEIGPGTPEIAKLRTFHDHPGFIQAMADHVRTALDQIPSNRRASAPTSRRTASPSRWPKPARMYRNSRSRAGWCPRPWAVREFSSTRAGADRRRRPG